MKVTPQLAVAPLAHGDDMRWNLNDDGINFNPSGRCAPGHRCKRGQATPLKNQAMRRTTLLSAPHPKVCPSATNRSALCAANLPHRRNHGVAPVDVNT